MDAQTTSRRLTWVLYGGLIVANGLLAYDAWRDTPSGQAFESRIQARVAAVREKAQGCQGCARRKAALKRLTGHMLWDAERAAEGEPIKTVPDVVDQT